MNFILENLKEFISYNPITGDFVWIKQYKKSKPGDKVGYLLKSGYLRLSFKNFKIYLHRLAWAFEYGQFPDKNIDHMNGNKDDNRIINLRSVSQKTNMQNTKKPRSECGLIGVSKHRGKFKAEIRVNGIKKHLGVFNDPQKAHDAYLTAKLRHHPGYIPD